MGVDESAHKRRHRVGVDRLAPGSGEDVMVRAAPLRAYSQPLRGLMFAVISEHLHGVVVDGDGPGPSALGGPLDALPPITAVEPVTRTSPSRSMSLQRRLSSSPRRAPVYAASWKKANSRCCLAVARNARSWAGVHTVPGSGGPSWPLGPFHGVAAEGLVHDDGIVKRLPQHRVQIGHGATASGWPSRPPLVGRSR